MNPIRAAIYQRLATDAELTALLSLPTAIHHGVAPQTAGYPLIVFHKQAGTPAQSFDGPAIEWGVWTVKSVDRNTSANRAEDIAARIDVVLTRAPLVIGSGPVQLWRVSDVDYPETNAGEQLQHVGAQYRLASAPA